MASRREREKIQEVKIDEMYAMLEKILALLGEGDGKEAKNKEVKKNTRNAGK